MEDTTPKASAAPRVPVWALVVGPIVAAALSNADVLFLALAGPHIPSSGVGLALATTLPLRLGACGVTLWFLLRLRREVDRRSDAERTTRLAMKDLGRALEREKLLRKELDHRVRNNLAALLGIVTMYEGSEVSLADVLASLAGKIVTLRESYNLIAANHGDGIELSDLLAAILATVAGSGGGSRAISIAGPSVRLASREANAYSMIAHELLTNAAKHGALRHANGTIEVTWSSATINDEIRVELRWTEGPLHSSAAAPPACAPADGRSGLGLSLIRGLAGSDLRGTVDFSRKDDRWIVELTSVLKMSAEASLAGANAAFPQETLS